MVEGRQVDWAMAEAMAFGSLLKEGIHVRQAFFNVMSKLRYILCYATYISLIFLIIYQIRKGLIFNFKLNPGEL
jgi:hypothetical protein